MPANRSIIRFPAMGDMVGFHVAQVSLRKLGVPLPQRMGSPTVSTIGRFFHVSGFFPLGILNFSLNKNRCTARLKRIGQTASSSQQEWHP